MDIVNVIATTSIALSNIIQPIGEISIINTKTNTKIETSKELAAEAQIEKIQEIDLTEEIAIKTEEEIKNDNILAKWKVKQEEKWKKLSYERFIVNASAYTASADECGNSKGITASGIMVEEKRTLACPPEYPFGTIIEIEGMGRYRCEDRGGAIKGNKVDIYMKTKSEAFNFGRRNLLAWVVNE